MPASFNPYAMEGANPFNYKYDDPRESFNPWAYAGYGAQRGLINRAYGQQGRAATAAGSQQAAQAGLTGPARQAWMQQSLAPVQQAQAGEMAGLSAQYAQNLGNQYETERQRQFQQAMAGAGYQGQYGLQELAGQQALGQLQFPYQPLGGGASPWELEQQARRDEQAFQAWVAQMQGEGAETGNWDPYGTRYQEYLTQYGQTGQPWRGAPTTAPTQNPYEVTGGNTGGGPWGGYQDIYGQRRRTW